MIRIFRTQIHLLGRPRWISFTTAIDEALPQSAVNTTTAATLHYKYTQNQRAIHRSVAFHRPNLLAKHTRTPVQTPIDLVQHRSFQPGRSGCLTGIKKRRHPRFKTSKSCRSFQQKELTLLQGCVGKPPCESKASVQPKTTVAVRLRQRGKVGTQQIGFPSKLCEN